MIRRARESDIVFLVELRNRLAAHFLSTVPASPEITRALLADSETYVLEIEGRPIGSFAFYAQSGDEAYFGRFMLLPEQWENGHGRELLTFALEEAQRRGFRRLHLVTKPENVAAMHLYQSVGFKVTEIQMVLG